MNQLKEHLEQNFLDGDKIDDCGGATFTVHGALDIAEYFYELGKKEVNESHIEYEKGLIKDAKQETIDMVLKEIEGIEPDSSEINYEEDNFASGKREALYTLKQRILQAKQ